MLCDLHIPDSDLSPTHLPSLFEMLRERVQIDRLSDGHGGYRAVIYDAKRYVGSCRFFLFGPECELDGSRQDQATPNRQVPIDRAIWSNTYRVYQFAPESGELRMHSYKFGRVRRSRIQLDLHVERSGSLDTWRFNEESAGCNKSMIAGAYYDLCDEGECAEELGKAAALVDGVVTGYGSLNLERSNGLDVELTATVLLMSISLPKRRISSQGRITCTTPHNACSEIVGIVLSPCRERSLETNRLSCECRPDSFGV